MGKEAKKRIWGFKSPEEGSQVQDARKGASPIDPETEEDTLKKISNYNFDRPVRYHGFSDLPEEPPQGKRRRKNNNCLTPGVDNTLDIGPEDIDWYLKKS